jgi:hypothetical protein
MSEILNEIEDSKEQEKSTLYGGVNGSGMISAFERNAQFLNKEISFFLDNLRMKAMDHGLNEDSLLPLHDDRDQQICKQLVNLLLE